MWKLIEWEGMDKDLGTEIKDVNKENTLTVIT